MNLPLPRNERTLLQSKTLGSIAVAIVAPLALLAAALLSGCASADTSTPAATAEAPQSQAESRATKDDDHHAGHHEREAYTNADWWPNALDLHVLDHHDKSDNPYGDTFDYAAEFAKLDLKAVKKDIENLLTTSQDWWPADYGHYGGLMIRLAWHSAGTYRVTDGRGGSGSGSIRFAPLNSWPDNANLDKARRLLWPIKQKYGRKISWADLMVLTGNVALESMGFETLGFAGGREDVYAPEDVDWGPETQWLADQRFHKGKLKHGLAASQMGLIYVNPEGPGGVPDPIEAAKHIRTTFARMAMNDEETVALIAGGHTLGKVHGAHKPSDCVGPEPEAASLEEQGLGWKNKCGKGNAEDTVTSGLEGAWTRTPVKWSHDYFRHLFEFEWKLTKSPAGAKQWTPSNMEEKPVPDAHIKGKKHRPMMLTTDLALVKDPEYLKISRRFYENPKEFEKAFAKAWYKLTHRDLGPRARLLGKEVPPAQLWQDPVPAPKHPLVGKKEIANLKKQILKSGLSTGDLVFTAWASASTFRETDMRGGANGARIRLAPQKGWEANEPKRIAKALAKLGEIRDAFNKRKPGGKQISMADMIVLGGAAAVEDAARKAGHTLSVPFKPGRGDANEENTDAASFDVLEPKADGFRNYVGKGAFKGPQKNAPEALVEKANLLTLNAPEMAVLVAGLRVLGANHGGATHGVFTDKPGTLTNDFFVNLLASSGDWKKVKGEADLYEARDPKTGKVKWTGTSVDLIFGSNSQLRALSEVYGAKDGGKEFAKDFVAAWHKVMNLDRF